MTHFVESFIIPYCACALLFRALTLKRDVLPIMLMQVGDKVSGLLDFEFCSFDWRAMELAVALSKCVFVACLYQGGGDRGPK